jgi:hypothetical protein
MWTSVFLALPSSTVELGRARKKLVHKHCKITGDSFFLAPLQSYFWRRENLETGEPGDGRIWRRENLETGESGDGKKLRAALRAALELVSKRLEMTKSSANAIVYKVHHQIVILYHIFKCNISISCEIFWGI